MASQGPKRRERCVDVDVVELENVVLQRLDDASPCGIGTRDAVAGDPLSLDRITEFSSTD